MNLELRKEILECSLHMEKEINNLIFLFLGFYSENCKTRVFGDKSGNISFKNKIDLLFDLKILSNEENSDFNLLMTFRNKFLHVYDCDSFSYAFKLLGNGQKKELKKFLEDDESIDNEVNCLSAFKRLFLKNFKVLKDKIEIKKQLIAQKAEFVQNFKQQSLLQVDFFFDLIKEINENLVKSDLNDEKVQKVAEQITEICKRHSEKYSTNEKFSILKERQQELMTSQVFQKEFWNLVDFDTNKMD